MGRGRLAGNCTLSLRLAIEVQMLPDGDNRMTDLVDGELQLAFCHSKEMLKYHS
jgi:hypothetical protein